MRRLILQFTLILVLGAGFAWLADHPGSVTIDWNDVQINASFAIFAFLVAGIVLVALMIQGFWSWTRRELTVNRHVRKQQRGLEALNNAVLALAKGDAPKARRLTRQADRLLPPQPMTHVIAAQAAQLDGDSAGAEESYKKLQESSTSAFLGVRGLLTQAVDEGRGHAALGLAEEARRLEPNSPWAAHIHFDLLVRNDRFIDALEALKAVKRTKAMDESQENHHHGSLNYLIAAEHELAGRISDAKASAKKALKRRPGFLPTVLLLSRVENTMGKKAQATRALMEAWAVEPSLELLEAYLAGKNMERPRERLTRLEKLASKNPDHSLSVAVLEVAKAFAQDADPGDWSIKGLKDSGRWQCTNCGHGAEQWQRRCIGCDSFNTIHWLSPENQIIHKTQASVEEPMVLLGNVADSNPNVDDPKA
jgi:HemY protein